MDDDTSFRVDASQPAPANLCLTPKCGKEALWKGLCRSCYGQALKLIDGGKTTWDELRALGMCLLDDKPFVAEFKRRKMIADKSADPTKEYR